MRKYGGESKKKATIQSRNIKSPPPSPSPSPTKPPYKSAMQSPNTIFHTTKNTTTKPTTTKNPPRRPTTVHTSTTQACAACKYQRRKCASNCILAPYFPHDRQLQFLNAHRLFGVRNIVKMVSDLQPQEKEHAMRTIIFQSDARAADPVGGCYRIIRDLQHQISLSQMELEVVLHHLALCRAAAQQQKEEEVAAREEEDLNSWGCVGEDARAHVRAESTSSSFPQDQQHEGECWLEECDDMIRPILDHLVCDDVREDDFEFDSDGNIIPRNIAITEEEKAGMKEGEDINDAATFFSLTNSCDDRNQFCR